MMNFKMKNKTPIPMPSGNVEHTFLEVSYFPKRHKAVWKTPLNLYC